MIKVRAEIVGAVFADFADEKACGVIGVICYAFALIWVGFGIYGVAAEEGHQDYAGGEPCFERYLFQQIVKERRHYIYACAACKAEYQRSFKAYPAVEVAEISCVIPIFHMLEGLKIPAGEILHNGAEGHNKEKCEDVVVDKALEDYYSAYAAEAVYRQPRAEHCATIDENAVLNDMDTHFPQPADKGEDEEKQDIGHQRVVTVIVTVNDRFVGEATEMGGLVDFKAGVLVELTEIVKGQGSFHFHYASPPSGCWVFRV